MTAVLLIAAALFINLYGCAAIMEDGDYHSKVRKHPRIMHFFGKSFIGIIALTLAYMAGRGRMSGIVETQILRTLDKHDKIGTNGVVELLQKGPEDFGAGLDPVRAGLIGQFLECKGADSTETIANMKKWFYHAGKVMSRLRFIDILDQIETSQGKTMLDDLLDMPTNADETWSDGRRPHNIAFAIDDIISVIMAGRG